MPQPVSRTHSYLDQVDKIVDRNQKYMISHSDPEMIDGQMVDIVKTHPDIFAILDAILKVGLDPREHPKKPAPKR